MNTPYYKYQKFSKATFSTIYICHFKDKTAMSYTLRVTTGNLPLEVALLDLGSVHQYADVKFQ